MKSWERISITLILCLTLLAAVFLHGRLTRYVVVSQSNTAAYAYPFIRYDRITGKMWSVDGFRTREIRDFQ